jgi:hypothetical protein
MGKLVIVVLLSVLASRVWADKGEWRVGAGGGLTLMDARVGGVSGTGAGYDARARLAYGLSNTLDVGLVGGYAYASDISFEEAALGGQTGKLFADLSTIVLGAEMRWTLGLGLSRAFERTSPYLAARAGGALFVHTSQQVFTATNLVLLKAGDDLHIEAFAGAALGIEHRFGDHFFVAVELGASFSVDQRSFGLGAEAAWAWY